MSILDPNYIFREKENTNYFYLTDFFFHLPSQMALCVPAEESPAETTVCVRYTQRRGLATKFCRRHLEGSGLRGKNMVFCNSKFCVLSFARRRSYSTLMIPQSIADVCAHSWLWEGLHLIYIQFKIHYDLVSPTLGFRHSINFTGLGKMAFNFPESMSSSRHQFHGDAYLLGFFQLPHLQHIFIMLFNELLKTKFLKKSILCFWVFFERIKKLLKDSRIQHSLNLWHYP